MVGTATSRHLQPGSTEGRRLYDQQGRRRCGDLVRRVCSPSSKRSSMKKHPWYRRRHITNYPEGEGDIDRVIHVVKQRDTNAGYPLIYNLHTDYVLGHWRVRIWADDNWCRATSKTINFPIWIPPLFDATTNSPFIALSITRLDQWATMDSDLREIAFDLARRCEGPRFGRYGMESEIATLDNFMAAAVEETAARRRRLLCPK